MSSVEEHRRKPAPAGLHALHAAAPTGPDAFVEMLPGSEEFHVGTLSTDGVHRVVLRGELDLMGAPILARKIRELCAQPTRGLRLDLRRLSFMDSSGLHVVLNARELCARRGFSFAIVGGTPPVLRLFEVSGLAGLLAPQRP